MTDPSLYRDDSRVRHMLDAMERLQTRRSAEKLWKGAVVYLYPAEM